MRTATHQPPGARERAAERATVCCYRTFYRKYSRLGADRAGNAKGEDARAREA